MTNETHALECVRQTEAIRLAATVHGKAATGELCLGNAALYDWVKHRLTWVPSSEAVCWQCDTLKRQEKYGRKR
ncbi:hypothetical protein ABBQ38_012030 [Trebouxia sp. C0009 RCD-2024]